MDRYVNLVFSLGSALNLCITGFLFWYFVTPFLLKKKGLSATGVVYALVMLWLKLIPYELDGGVCYGIGTLAAFLVMYRMDRRNGKQKIFLSLTFYLLNWIAWGIVLGPWDILYSVIIRGQNLSGYPGIRFVLFVIIEVLFVTMDIAAEVLLIKVIHGAYHYKSENLTIREFILLSAPSFSVMAGYWIINFYSRIYEKDLGQYIEDNHFEFIWLRALYMAISFAALLVVILSYQRIKDGQRKEKEDAVFSRQMEDMKRHMEEIERLYFDIRSLKHDMANHVMLLERLYGKEGSGEEQDGGQIERVRGRKEAAEYMTKLKAHVEESVLEMKSGNPVTDVILREKRKEAEAKGIAFRTDFHYPQDTNVEAFDLSILLNNAINNAIEAAQTCRESFISVQSYRRRNAYMIEVWNSCDGVRAVDEESGLPYSTKKEPGHGFGLATMRKVAQRYHGDIDVRQDGESFILSIMIMVSG